MHVLRREVAGLHVAANQHELASLEPDCLRRYGRIPVHVFRSEVVGPHAVRATSFLFYAFLALSRLHTLGCATLGVLRGVYRNALTIERVWIRIGCSATHLELREGLENVFSGQVFKTFWRVFLSGNTQKVCRGGFDT